MSKNKTKPYTDEEDKFAALEVWREGAVPMDLFGDRLTRERDGNPPPSHKRLQASGLLAVVSVWICAERFTFEVELEL